MSVDARLAPPWNAPEAAAPILGSNVSTVGGLPRAFDQARMWDCRAIQIYTTPSRRWAVPTRSAEQVEEFTSTRSDSPVQAVIAHVPFLVNLASESAEIRRRSAARLIEEVRSAGELGVGAIVLHPGSAGRGDRRVGLERLVEAVQATLQRTRDFETMILLENMAGQGGMLGADFRELAEILGLIGEPKRVGVCFDTAHAFMAGYPLAGYDGYRETIDLLDKLIGCERVHAVHVNDSLTPQGSRHDRHAAPGRGNMGIAVFHALVLDPRFAAIPMVLEVPDRDRDSLPALQLLRALAQRSEPVHECADYPARASSLTQQLPL